MAALVCLIINIILIVINIKIYKDNFSPPLVLNLMWGFVNFMNLALGWNSNEVEYLILCLPSFMFTLGFILATGSLRNNKRTLVQPSDMDFIRKYSHISEKIVFLLAIVFAIIFFLFILNNFQTYFKNTIWYTLRRISWLEDTKEIGILQYPSIPVFLLPSYYLFIMRRNRSKALRFRFIIVLTLALVWSYLTTSRTATFTVIAFAIISQITYSNVTVQNVREKRKIRRAIIMAGILIMVIFVYVSTQKSGQQFGSISLFSFALNNIINYTNLSAACFVDWFQGGYVQKLGQISFRFIYAILAAFGMNVEVVNTNSGGLFLNIGDFSTNAFTVARNYTEDFGVLYMALILCLFGIIHGYVYKNARLETGVMRIRYSLLNAMLFIPLVYQILTDQYLSTLSGWIQYTLWIILFTSKLFFPDSGRTKRRAIIVRN